MLSPIIIYLLRKGAHREPKRITTGEIAADTGVSQQTASRKLIELERGRLLVRDGGRLLLTDKAISDVRKLLRELLESLEGTSIVFASKVVQGLGEGAYYMSQKKYMSQFARKLCFRPHPGTLNVAISEEDIEKRLLLREQKPISLSGFSNSGRSFGKIDAYRCTVEGVQSAIIFPERSLHGLQTLEIVSKFNLRKKLSLVDGALVKVEVVKNLPC